MAERSEASRKISEDQAKAKLRYDRKRKPSRDYKEGDLVLLEKQDTSHTGSSRKLTAPFAIPMVVKKVLRNDRYVVCDMDNSHRNSRSTKYERVVAVDKLKPWMQPGGVSDDSDIESVN